MAGIPLDAVTWLGLRPRRHGGCSEESGGCSGKMGRMKALVTGGAGFIGSNLVDALVERGDDVRVLDNFSTGNRANLEGLEVEVVEGELRSYERVHAAVRGIEVVYHLGALGSVPRSVQDPLTSSAVNIEGTLNVLLAARDEGVRRVIFSSSTSVYGSNRELPTVGDDSARPDLAVRRREARRRAVLHQLQPRLRVVRDGRASILQRLRPAAEPALAVRRGRAALHRRDRSGRAGHDPRRRRAVARLHVRRERRRRDDSRSGGGRGQRTRLQRRRRLAGEREPRRRHDRRSFSASRSRSASSRRGPETSETPGPTSPRHARCSATSRGSTSPQGWSSRPRPSLPRSDKPRSRSCASSPDSTWAARRCTSPI